MAEIPNDKDAVMDSDGWSTVTRQKKINPYIKSTETVIEENAQDKTNQRDISNDKTTERLVSKHSNKISSIDLIKKHFDGFRDHEIYKAAHYLLTLILRGAKENLYTKYYQSIDIIKHIPASSINYFHQVVNHNDPSMSIKVALYDWTYNGKHIFIFTTSPWSRSDGKTKTPLAIKHAWYNNTTRENIRCNEENPDSGILTDEGFDLLRNMALKDISSELFKLQFFKDYNLAKAAVQMSTSERVQFLKKNSKDFSKSKNAGSS